MPLTESQKRYYDRLARERRANAPTIRQHHGINSTSTPRQSTGMHIVRSINRGANKIYSLLPKQVGQVFAMSPMGMLYNGTRKAVNDFVSPEAAEVADAAINISTIGKSVKGGIKTGKSVYKTGKKVYNTYNTIKQIPNIAKTFAAANAVTPSNVPLLTGPEQMHFNRKAFSRMIDDGVGTKKFRTEIRNNPFLNAKFNTFKNNSNRKPFNFNKDGEHRPEPEVTANNKRFRKEQRQFRKLYDRFRYYNDKNIEPAHGFTGFGTRHGIYMSNPHIDRIPYIDFVNKEGIDPSATGIPKEVKFRHNIPFADDIQSRSYESKAMLADPNIAMEKMYGDIKDLKSGQADHLTRNGATSEDSYSWQNALYQRGSNNGLGEYRFLRDVDGNPVYQTLNNKGRRRRLDDPLTGNKNKARLNRQIREMWESSGETGDIPYVKIAPNGVVSVPSRYFRRYKFGGQTFKSRF